MRGVWLVVVLTACHSVFDLERVADPPDAATGHDDDGDGIPDVVDLCPGMPGTDAGDDDDDGLGDLCDPTPTVANQQHGEFLELAGTDLVNWATTNGAWSPETSAFVQTDVNADSARVERDVVTGNPPWTIELALEPTGIGSLASFPRVGIYSDDRNVVSTERYACGFRYEAGWNIDFGHPGSDTQTDVGLPLRTAQRYTLQLTIENNTSARCRVFDGTTWYDAPAGMGGTTSTLLAVDVQAVAVRLHSIAIYQAAAPP